MTRSLRMILPAACLALAATAFAQAPAGTPPAGAPPAGQRPRGPRPAPTNLKALPKDTTGDQVIAIMHSFEGALGVECEYCHAPRNPETRRSDFASDANPVKDRARVMIKMVQAINTDYISQLNNPKAGNPVTCGTCHRGSPKPTVFVPKEEERGPRPAAAAPAPAPKQ